MSKQSQLVQEATSDARITSMTTQYAACNLTFTMPQQTKKDKRAQHDAEVANNAHGAVKASRRLWSKPTMAPFNACASAARSYLRSRTTQVGEELLIHKTMVQEVLHDMHHEYFVQFDQLKIKFGQDYANILADAEKSQGRLFDASVYTGVQGVVDQFTRSFDIYGIGNVSDGFFSDMETDIANDVADAVQASNQRRMQVALERPLADLIKLVMNVHNKTARDNSRIAESVMGDLEELTALMPMLNVVGLDYLNDMAAKCRAELIASVDEIRNKESGRREQVADSAGDILSSFGIDPEANTMIDDATERKETAKAQAAEILSQMKGVW